MKAIVYERYGPVDQVRFEDSPAPVPAEDEILVRNFASSVNYGNLALINGKPFISRFWSGLLRPRDTIQGGDVAGEVVEVGSGVEDFRVGDAVYADTSSNGFGAYAEYVRVPGRIAAHKPEHLDYNETAAIPQAGLVALQGLRNKGHITAGQNVLVVGASGGNGSFAVQIAKALGANVTAVCSTESMEMVHGLGVDEIINYKTEDFLDTGRQWDLIIGAGGYRSIKEYKRALTPKGTYVMLGGSMKQVMEANLYGPFMSSKKGMAFTSLYHRPDQGDLIYMKQLMERHNIRPVIDKVYPLEQTAQALSYYAGGHAHGKVVISIRGDQ